MTTINMWAGGVTHESMVVKAKVSSGNTATLSYSNVTTPDDVQFVEVAVVDQIATFELTGLKPRNTYNYTVGELSGRIRTLPTPGQPADFTIATGSCAGQYLKGVNGEVAVTNGEVFRHIQQADPDMFIHMGDLHYKNINTPDVSLFDKGFDDVLAQPNQAGLYQNIPLAYVWDDHDYGANDSTKESPSRPAAVVAYRKRAPHYPLADPEGIWQTWVIGRVRFIMTDQRSSADLAYQMPGYVVPRHPEKTMMGAAQKQWFKDILNTSEEEMLVWVNTVPWHPDESQITSWSAYRHEREEIAAFLKDTGWARRMIMVSGDWHGMGLDSGKSNQHGGFPVYHFAPIDSNPSATPDPFPLDLGTSIKENQWGYLTFQDDGNTIRVTVEGKVVATTVLSTAFMVGDDQGTAQPNPVYETEVVVKTHHLDEVMSGTVTTWAGEPTPVKNVHVGRFPLTGDYMNR